MLIKNAKITTGTGKNIEDGFVLIKDGKISKLGKMADLKDEKADKVLDIKGSYLYPGLIDAHTHIGLRGWGVGFEADDVNEMTDPVRSEVRALDGTNPLDGYFKEAREAGVTTVLLSPGSANPIGGAISAVKTKGTDIEKMLLKENIGMKFALGENPRRVYGTQGKSPRTRMGTAAIIRETLELAKRYGEREDKNKFDAKLEALLPVLSGEVKAHIHCHRADDIQTAIRIAKEYKLNYTIIHGTEGYMIPDSLKDNKTEMIIGPLLTSHSKPEVRNSTFRSGAVLDENDIKFALCTDHPVIPIAMLALTAGLMVREGLSKDVAVMSITRNAADIAGIADRVGTIEVGKDADLIICDEDIFSVYAGPKTVIMDGEIVHERKA